ncbi:MAG: MFS transporter [Pirellulales bacterium]|nr:MFS transporter [Pirellulales bacterium]
MSLPATESPPDAPPRSSHWPSHPELEAREPRNLLVLVVHQVVFRIAWMFKTESVVIPAFLDSVAGAGWIRGCLPVLSRFGLHVPPVFFAEPLRRIPRKKVALGVLGVLMSAPFALMAGILALTAGTKPSWMPWVFLGLYTVFFILTGLYFLAFNTLQGRVIRPTRRGRLLLLGTFWGTIPAVAISLWLMPGWLGRATPAFGPTFLFVAGGFFIAGLIGLLTFEPPSTDDRPKIPWLSSLADVVRTVRADANLRRLLLVVMLGSSSLLLMPHYQALAREELGIGGGNLTFWVIAQSISVGIISLLVGLLADSRGYRVTLQLLVVGSTLAPALSMGLAQWGQPWGGRLYFLVFAAFGIAPMGFRATANYTLEICEPAQHTRYLSTVALGSAVPYLVSPLVGELVDLIGFRIVFSTVIALTLLGGVLSLRLEEPRHRLAPEEAESLVLPADE